MTTEADGKLSASVAHADVRQDATVKSVALHRRNALLIGLVYCLVMLALTPTTISLAQTWNDFESLSQSHGWLIAACVVWIIYEAAGTGPAVQVSGLSYRAWSVIVASFVWLLAVAANVQIVHQVLLPIVAIAIVYGLYGWSVARHYSFAFVFLYFAMAVWGIFNAPLQWATVYAMRVLVRAVGIPAFLHGNFIELPSGLMVVEGGCSGLNFFVVALALSALYAYLNNVRRWWLLVALGAVLAIAANWIRVLTIVVAGYVTDMQHYLVSVEHIRFGWAVFAVTMAIFFVIANRMETLPIKPRSIAPEAGSSVVENRQTIIVVLAALLFGPAWYWVSQARGDASLVAEMSPSSSLWSAAQPSDDWSPLFKGADLQRAYRWQLDSEFVDGFQAIYFKQSQSRKLAGFENTVFGASLQPTATMPPPIDRIAISQMIVVNSANERWLIWHRYTAGDAKFATARRAQMVAGLRSLVIPTIATVEAWRARCDSDCTAAARILDRIVPVQE